MAIRAGVDTGGTFTDVVLWNGASFSTRKVRSTPDDPSRAILEGLAGLDVEEVVHGSTVATNAILERRGAKTAFLTTEGFVDLLLIGRQNRRELYNLTPDRIEPLVPRDWTIGVPERMLYDGSVEVPLERETAQLIAEQVRSMGAESVAICLLHAYANGDHERILAEELGGIFVSASHEILPEYREFERASTTAVNAYVSPVMSRYLCNLREALGRTRLRVFQSNGGSISAEFAGRDAIQTVLSGPAGGVLGAAAVARATGFERIISFDMGGTSTDVSLYDGQLSFTSETVLADLPIRVPMLDVHSVGAGGGSIAYLDAAGALRVGPRSAGANPGPVCYGEGSEITVTDANVLLGRIDTKRFLGGRMELDVERARFEMRALAERAGVSPDRLAEAIVDVANSNMERAIRKVSIERGRDPRDFALLSFGGAGAQHACALASRLDIRTVIVPAHAGVLSAVGMLAADCVRDYSVSVLGRDAEAAYSGLEAQAGREFAEQGYDEVIFERSIDLRYRGQSFEITVPWAERKEFDAAHRKLYGYDHTGREVEAVTARVRAIAPLDKIDVIAPSERQSFSSLYVPPGWNEREDNAGNTILTKRN